MGRQVDLFAKGKFCEELIGLKFLMLLHLFLSINLINGSAQSLEVSGLSKIVLETIFLKILFNGRVCLIVISYLFLNCQICTLSPDLRISGVLLMNFSIYLYMISFLIEVFMSNYNLNCDDFSCVIFLCGACFDQAGNEYADLSICRKCAYYHYCNTCDHSNCEKMEE